MVSNNKIILHIISIALLSVFVFAKCNHKINSSVNAYIVEHTDEWQKIKSQNIDTSNSIKVKLQFLNNPYKFDSKNDLAVYINQALVFKGSFQNFIDVYLPNKFLGDRAIPAITIYDGMKAYNFIHKKSMFFDTDDKYLYVVFFPDNELTESCYMFSQKEEIL